MSRPITPSATGQAGLTFFEVIGATIVLALAVVSSAMVMTTANSTRAALQAGTIDAALLASHVHEVAVGLSKKTSGLPIASAGNEVLALDTLDGAVFSPPIDARLAVIPGSTGWAQQVDLRTVDPTGATTPRNFSGPNPVAAAMVELSVTVTHMGRAVDTFTWWLSP